MSSTAPTPRLTTAACTAADTCTGGAACAAACAAPGAWRAPPRRALPPVPRPAPLPLGRRWHGALALAGGATAAAAAWCGLGPGRVVSTAGRALLSAGLSRKMRRVWSMVVLGSPPSPCRKVACAHGVLRPIVMRGG
eukprot:scaffold6976_cov69-Phaeocystis_antarctica.AAC.4